MLAQKQFYYAPIQEMGKHLNGKQKLKAKYAFEKTKRAGKAIYPLFKKDTVSDFTNEILREDEDLRRRVMLNPEYRNILEHKVQEVFKEYQGILKGSKLVDKWDRVTSTIGLVGDAVGPFSGGIGNLISLGEEIPELIPKVFTDYAKKQRLKAILIGRQWKQHLYIY